MMREMENEKIEVFWDRAIQWNEYHQAREHVLEAKGAEEGKRNKLIDEAVRISTEPKHGILEGALEIDSLP